jgi:hypothetical protein
MIKEQNEKYIDSEISNVFHFLELKGSHNFLIGSANIRNILYANDYDLNAVVNVPNDTISVLKRVYQEFLHIFETAFRNPDYYILDFKCGIDSNGEPIRWSYKDLKKGHKDGYTFDECLIQDNEENVIKLDICYLYHGIFTDINCLYHLFIVNNKSELKKEKMKMQKQSVQGLKADIKELENNHEYMKALKRYFSLSLIKGTMDKTILDTLNSDLGLFYKFIRFLKLVIEMIEQTFKPVDLKVIKQNLQYIKQVASHIVEIDIESHLNQLIKIIDLSSKGKIVSSLEKLIEECSRELNNHVLSLIK